MRLPGPDSQITSEVGHVLATGALWITGQTRREWESKGKEREVSMTRHWAAAHWPPTFAAAVVPACAGLRLHVRCAPCGAVPRSPYPCTFPVRLGGQVREPGSGQGNK